MDSLYSFFFFNFIIIIFSPPPHKLTCVLLRKMKKCLQLLKWYLFRDIKKNIGVSPTKKKGKT